MIRLRTLGQIDLTFDGDGDGDGDALVAQPKRFALLCYLAIPKPGTMVRRDTLLGVFWPEGDSEHTRTALRQALAHIRKSLGHDVIVRRGSEEVGLNPDFFWCDVAAFERALDAGNLADAAELYQGELLKGFFLSNALEFERWVDAVRVRLASRYAHALEELANAANATGKTRVAVEWWQSLVRHDPFDSRYATGLMEALERAGDPANALLYARKHRALLRDELNITLPPEIRSLERRVRGRCSDPVVTEMPSSGMNVTADSETNGQPTQPTPVKVSFQKPHRPWWSRLHLRIAIPGFFLFLFAALLGIKLWKLQETAPAPVAPAVALFRLQNLGLPEDSVFALGVTDALITRLSRISGLRIRFANSSLSDAGLAVDQIASRFGVSHLLTGSFLRDPTRDVGGEIRISVQLLQTSDGTCVWAEDFEIEPSDLFHMYSDVGGQVAGALSLTLLDEERAALAERPTRDPRAYEYFLVGNAYFEDAFPINPELWNAVEWYEKAIAADPQFALAYAKLSMAHGGLYWGWRDRSEERLEKQRAAADTALRLQPGLPEGHLAMGVYYYWAHYAYDQALEVMASVHDQLETNYWYLVVTAAIQRRMGNFPEAAERFADASDLNPLAFSPAAEAGDTYRNLRSFGEAHRYLDRYVATRPGRAATYLRKALAYLEEDGDVEKAREALMRGPPGVPFEEMIATAARYRCSYNWARVVRILCGDCLSSLDRVERDTSAVDQWHYYMGMALLYDRAGESSLERAYYDSSAVLLQGFIQHQPEEEHYHADLGLVYAELGRKDEAIREATIAVGLSDPLGDAWAGYMSTRKRAEVYSLVGEPDSAVADLELILSTFVAAPQTGRYISPVTHVPLMCIDPIWDPIRDHPTFQALLEKYDPLR